MARLVLMVGLPGAGKTTLARRLAREMPALHLNPDEWVETLYGGDLSDERLDAVRYPMEDVAWSIAERALRIGTSVILDFGFWSRAEREDYRSRAARLGAESEVRYLECPLEVLLDRVEKRNRDLPPGTMRVSREQILSWWEVFEPPLEDELAVRGIR